MTDEHIVNVDMEAETERGVIAAWALGTLTKYIWECLYNNNAPILAKLVGRMRAELVNLRTHSPLLSRAVLAETMMDKYLLV